jgi:hypothetical protein
MEMRDTCIRPKIGGLALGFFWGTTLFLWTLISVMTGYSKEILTLIASVYPGYTLSLMGSLIGLAYGFLDGFISGFILAWIYGKLAERL